MQSVLDRFSLPLTLCWLPDQNSRVHGEIKKGVLFLYDLEEKEAWNTFTHEVIEYEHKEVTQPYRAVINSLIAAFEETTYFQKEKFIEKLPNLLKTIQEAEYGAITRDNIRRKQTCYKMTPP